MELLFVESGKDQNLDFHLDTDDKRDYEFEETLVRELGNERKYKKVGQKEKKR